MNHTDAFGQSYGPGDLVAFSSGYGRSTKLHIAEVLDITPIEEGAYGYNVEAPYTGKRDDRGRPIRIVGGVNVRVQTLATTRRLHGEVVTKKPAIPLTRNIVRWNGWDPRKEFPDE